jgi:hypothetical protein
MTNSCFIYEQNPNLEKLSLSLSFSLCFHNQGMNAKIVTRKEAEDRPRQHCNIWPRVSGPSPKKL